MPADLLAACRRIDKQAFQLGGSVTHGDEGAAAESAAGPAGDEEGNLRSVECVLIKVMAALGGVERIGIGPMPCQADRALLAGGPARGRSSGPPSCRRGDLASGRMRRPILMVAHAAILAHGLQQNRVKLCEDQPGLVHLTAGNHAILGEATVAGTEDAGKTPVAVERRRPRGVPHRRRDGDEALVLDRPGARPRDTRG